MELARRPRIPARRCASAGRRLAAATLAGASVLLSSSSALACPGCAEALDGTSAGAGFNASILFLILTPAALVIAGMAVIYLLSHRPGEARPAASPVKEIST